MSEDYAVKPGVFNAQIYAEASDWLVEFRSGDIDAQGRKDFCQWLKTSPEHMRAYLELAAIWNEGTALDHVGAFDDARLLRDMEAEMNVASLPGSRARQAEAGGLSAPQPTLGRSLPKETRKTREGALARSWMGTRRLIAFAASLLAIISLSFWYANTHDTYVTGLGENRAIVLADGSTIELNSNSRVRINFSREARGVELLRGQALFHVAKDHTRPFIVHTNDILVRAVGTQFDVYRNQATTTVTVVEGTVAVSPAVLESAVAVGRTTDNTASPPNSGLGIRAGRGEILLAAGEQVTVAPGETPKPVKSDVSAATSWTRHQLTFEGASLESVAKEFNRYNERHIIIRDSQISGLKVTGIFSSTSPSSLIRFLETRPDISVTESGNEILVSRKQ